MNDIWMLCKKVNNVLTAVGVDTTEQAARDLAEDGDFIVIPIRFGRVYPNLVDEGNVGAVAFSNIALKTLLQQAKARLDAIDQDIQQIKAQGQQMNQTLQDLDVRVTALETS